MSDRQVAMDGQAGTERMPGWAQARQAVLDLYDACGLPPPRIHVAQSVEGFARSVVLAGEIRPGSMRRNVLIACFPLVVAAAIVTGIVYLFYCSVAGSPGCSVATLPMLLLLTLVLDAEAFRFVSAVLSFRTKTPFEAPLVPSQHLIDCLTGCGRVARPPGQVENRFVRLGASPAPLEGEAVLGSRTGALVDALRENVSDALLSGTDVLLLPRGSEADWKPDVSPRKLSKRASRKMLRSARRAVPSEAVTDLQSVGNSMSARIADDGIRREFGDWREQLAKASVLKHVSSARLGSLWEFRTGEYRLLWLRREWFREDVGGGQPREWLQVPSHMSDAREAIAWSRGWQPVELDDVPGDAETMFTELYRACGLPRPTVLVARSRGIFAELAERTQDSRATRLAVLYAICLSVQFAVVAVVASLLPAETVADTALRIFVEASMVLLSGAFAWRAYRNHRRLLLNPLRRRFRRDAMLNHALASAGCITGSSLGRIQGVVAWGCPHMWPESATAPGHRSRVGDLFAEARRMAPAAVLGNGAVIALVEPVGEATAGGPPDEALRRRVEAACRLPAAEAQHELEFLGPAAVMAALGKQPRVRDGRGALWQVEVSDGRVTWLQARDPATGNDVWMVVPGHLVTPGEAVAWTYGLSEIDYCPTLEG